MAAIVEVTAGVLFRDQAVLVCRRPPGGHHPGKWEFPGGKVESGETLEECMRRELAEELGIDAVVGRRLWRTEHQYDGRPPLALTFFAIPRFSGTLTNTCFAAIRWQRIAELDRVDFLDGDRPFVGALLRGDVPLA